MNIGNMKPVSVFVFNFIQITMALNWMVRQTSELEANMVAIERTKEYTELPTEVPHLIKEGDRLVICI